ncbi:hypothetical protein [Nocardia sp. NBC_01009]|uniref:hypothetical protein n=1 Tax=Nocardia sp. NBC_01009 TaxID=2975996 RepID=UPI003865B65B|nr:hypothetical protein OHA42_18350 [Nocardia sp. NBC_01009]
MEKRLDHGLPEDNTVEPAMVHSVLAPSIRNTQSWRRRSATAPCAPGVPASKTRSPPTGHDLPAEAFWTALSADLARESDFGEVLLLGTSAEDRLTRLRAGEAKSAVSLTATNAGIGNLRADRTAGGPELWHKLRLVNGACTHPARRVH